VTQPVWGAEAPAEARPRRTPVADIFEETFRLYRRSFLLMVGIYAVFQVPIVVASVPFQLWQLRWSQRGFGSPFAVGASGLNSSDALAEYGALLLDGIALAIIAVILGTFAAAAITYIVARVRNGDQPTAREVFLALRRLAGPIFVYLVLFVAGFVVLVIGLTLAASIVVTVLYVVLGRAGGGAFALLTIVALVAAVIGCVALATRLALAEQALVLERARPTDAFRRSWNLVRGSTWRTFGILLLAGIVVGLLGALVSPIFLPGVMQGIMSGSPAAYLLVTAASGIAQIVLGPLIPALLTVLYFDYAARPT
jgi:hypothetical protein